MTTDQASDSIDLWHQVAAAVEYIAAIEQPGFTVWDAVEQALIDWFAPPDSDSHLQPAVDDGLRSALEAVLTRPAPAGVPGGQSTAAIISSALAMWLTEAEERLNNAHRFEAVPRIFP